MEIDIKSLQKLNTCNSKLIAVAIEAASNMPDGVIFKITCGHRTLDEQFELFKQGRTNVINQGWIVSNKSKVVTNCDGIDTVSNHNYKPSRAFDFALFIDKKLTWKVENYKNCGEIFKTAASKLGININWPINIGSEKKTKFDWPHIELNGI